MKDVFFCLTPVANSGRQTVPRPRRQQPPDLLVLAEAACLFHHHGIALDVDALAHRRLRPAPLELHHFRKV